MSLKGEHAGRSPARENTGVCVQTDTATETLHTCLLPQVSLPTQKNSQEDSLPTVSPQLPPAPLFDSCYHPPSSSNGPSDTCDNSTRPVCTPCNALPATSCDCNYRRRTERRPSLPGRTSETCTFSSFSLGPSSPEPPLHQDDCRLCQSKRLRRKKGGEKKKMGKVRTPDGGDCHTLCTQQRTHGGFQTRTTRDLPRMRTGKRGAKPLGG
mmetsp:Transcript_6783/g.13364  ORF Transcript_6783/g.13364 Transcript_6783/m.13364 type:complete len:210 (-) Transcript_6783:610-1239(-)